MGARAVRSVLAQYRDLDSTAMRLLVHMASISLDPPGRADLPALTYFGGWETQAWHLGYDVPGGTDTSSVTRAQSVRRLTYSVRRRLVDAGAITLVKHHAPGRTQVWKINTDE